MLKRAMLAVALLAFMNASHSSTTVLRDTAGLPQCFELPELASNMHIKTIDRPLSREVYLHFSSRRCSEHDFVKNDESVLWSVFNNSLINILPASVIEELVQIEQKTNVIRRHLKPAAFIDHHDIKVYTVELNRKLTADYGQTFSAQVFREIVEREPKSNELLQSVLHDLKVKNKSKNRNLKVLRGKIRLVVSFGLGWEESYTKHTPYYIRDFLADIKSLGLPVTFLKKDAYGTVENNVEQMIPQLKERLGGEEDLILISLCKGTPELFAALARVNQDMNQSSQARIIGHINLSGMLSGAIFSDFAKELIFPKIIAPLLKLIPFAGVADSGKMVDALEFMKTSIIETVLQDAAPYLRKDLYTINVTGAPMDNSLMETDSPMKFVVKYGVRNAFIDSANDGFLELPSTLVPQSISTNQATLVVNSSHMLSDGDFYGYKLNDESNRRQLYFSVISEIIKKDPQYAGLLQ